MPFVQQSRLCEAGRWSRRNWRFVVQRMNGHLQIGPGNPFLFGSIADGVVALSEVSPELNARLRAEWHEAPCRNQAKSTGVHLHRVVIVCALIEFGAVYRRCNIPALERPNMPSLSSDAFGVDSAGSW